MSSMTGNSSTSGAVWRHSWGAAAIRRSEIRHRRQTPRPERTTARPAAYFGSHGSASTSEAVFTVREFTVPRHRRLAEAIAQAAIVRDVAAFGAMVLFGTMLALVLGGEPIL